VQDITSELGAQAMLEQLLPNLARALGTTHLACTSPTPRCTWSRGHAGRGPAAQRAGGRRRGPADDWIDAEWRLPLAVRGRTLGQMTARLVLRPAQGRRGAAAQHRRQPGGHHRRERAPVRRRAAARGGAGSLVEAGHLLASTLKVEEVLQRFTELVRTRLSVDVVRIWLHERDTEYRLAAQAGLAEKPGLMRMQFAPGEGAVGWIMEHLTPLMLRDLLVDPRFRERAWAQSEGLQSFVGVPLMLDDVPIGCCCAGRGSIASSPRRTSRSRRRWPRRRPSASATRVCTRNAAALRHTETLVSVSQAVGATLDLSEILRRATREMVRALGGDTGVAWLVTPGTNTVAPLVGYHIPRTSSPRGPSSRCGATRRSSSVCAHTARSRRVTVQPERGPTCRWRTHRPQVHPDPTDVLEGSGHGGFTVLWIRERPPLHADERGWPRASRSRARWPSRTRGCTRA